MADIQKVHISTVRAGDTIVHDGKEETVNPSDLSRGFCGHCVFGDSYRMGTLPVQKVMLRH